MRRHGLFRPSPTKETARESPDVGTGITSSTPHPLSWSAGSMALRSAEKASPPIQPGRRCTPQITVSRETLAPPSCLRRSQPMRRSSRSAPRGKQEREPRTLHAQGSHRSLGACRTAESRTISREQFRGGWRRATAVSAPSLGESRSPARVTITARSRQTRRARRPSFRGCSFGRTA